MPPQWCEIPNGNGMGVAFTDLDDTRKALLESWIEKVASPAPGRFVVSPHSENTNFLAFWRTRRPGVAAY